MIKEIRNAVVCVGRLQEVPCGVLHHILDTCHRSALYTGCPRRNVPDFGRVFQLLGKDSFKSAEQELYVEPQEDHTFLWPLSP